MMLIPVAKERITMTLSPELLARVDGLRGGGSRSSQVELLCWAALGRRVGGSSEPAAGELVSGREASRERSTRIQERVRGF